jgi:hypothetical protein
MTLLASISEIIVPELLALEAEFDAAREAAAACSDDRTLDVVDAVLNQVIDRIIKAPASTKAGLRVKFKAWYWWAGFAYVWFDETMDVDGMQELWSRTVSIYRPRKGRAP